MKLVRFFILCIYLLLAIELIDSALKLFYIWDQYLSSYDTEYFHSILFGKIDFYIVLIFYYLLMILFTIISFIFFYYKKINYFIVNILFKCIFLFYFLHLSFKGGLFYKMSHHDNFHLIIGDVYKGLYLTIILIALVLLIKTDYLEVYIKNKLKDFFDLLVNINFKKKINLIALFILFLFVMLLVPFINQYKTTESAKPISKIKIFEPKMIKIIGGSFLMGSTEVEINSVKPEGSESLIRYKEKIKDELKQRNISLKDFEISETEITKGQFKQFVNQSKIKINNNCSSFDYSKRKTAGDIDYVNWENPGFEQTDNHPVTCITWQEAQEYIKWLNQNTGKKYRLLSEAEWEYVAKAGCTSQYNIAGQCKEKIEPSQANFDGRIQFNGSQISDLKRVGTQAVGSYQPNQMNVYDMHGNIAEFVEDCHEINYLQQQPTDGSAHRVNDCQFSHRVYRGGSWNDAPYRLRANYRSSTFYSNNATGFRLARSLP